jgi:hypothetical protein
MSTLKKCFKNFYLSSKLCVNDRELALYRKFVNEIPVEINGKMVWDLTQFAVINLLFCLGCV